MTSQQATLSESDALRVRHWADEVSQMARRLKSLEASVDAMAAVCAGVELRDFIGGCSGDLAEARDCLELAQDGLEEALRTHFAAKHAADSDEDA